MSRYYIKSYNSETDETVTHDVTCDPIAARSLVGRYERQDRAKGLNRMWFYHVNGQDVHNYYGNASLLK